MKWEGKAASRQPGRDTLATSQQNIAHMLVHWESCLSGFWNPCGRAGSCRLGHPGQNNHYGNLNYTISHCLAPAVAAGSVARLDTVIAAEAAAAAAVCTALPTSQQCRRAAAAEPLGVVPVTVGGGFQWLGDWLWQWPTVTLSSSRRHSWPGAKAVTLGHWLTDLAVTRWVTAQPGPAHAIVTGTVGPQY